MKANVKYCLSSAGQKAALVAGLPATREQFTDIEVPSGDIDLFHVSSSGALSADATDGGEYKNDWNRSWKAFEFDSLPSAEDLIGFLRDRTAKREEVLRRESEAKKAAHVTEELKKHEYTQALLLRIRSGEDLDRLITDSYPDRISDGYVTLESKDYPEVAEVCERKKAKKAKATAAQGRRNTIDLAAPVVEIRETHLESSGNWTFLCPDSTISEKWAKHVTGTNSQAGGYGLEGEWLKIGTSCTLAPGEIIVVCGKEWRGSRKNGSYFYDVRIEKTPTVNRPTSPRLW